VKSGETQKLKMTDQSSKYIPEFYITAPAPCPYLEGQMERKVFTSLVGPFADQFHNQLILEGFRRSQNIAYKPACEDCSACVSVRIVVDDFIMSRSFKRIVQQNRDLQAEFKPPEATSEQYAILRPYLDARHSDGGMADMSVHDYAGMVEETSTTTHLVEYRSGARLSARPRPLVGTVLTDVLEDGLSMVYSFFGPEYSDRSLGSFMILDHIRQAQKRGLPHVYLGYWIQNCAKMDYKQRFKPLEYLKTGKWLPFSEF
jgi:leucyl-tRNA---protein transferase